MKKVLYINDVVFSKSSGELTHTVGVLNALSKKSNVVYVTSRKNKNILDERGLSKEITMVFIPFLNKFLFRFFYYLFVSFYAVKKFDAIYVRESVYSFMLIPMSVFSGKKMFIEYNGVSMAEVTGIKRYFLKIIGVFSRFLAKSVNTNIAVSSGIKKYYLDKWRISNFVVINNGTDIAYRTRFSTVHDFLVEKNIVFIGHIAAWQNFELLLQFVQKNKELLDRESIVFDIYGSGAGINHWKSEVEHLELQNLIRFKGVIDKQFIPSVLEKAYAGLLLDSRFYKGSPMFSPLKMYEYFAHDLPVIILSEEKTSISMDSLGVSVITHENAEDLALLLKTHKPSIAYRSWDDVSEEVLRII